LLSDEGSLSASTSGVTLVSVSGYVSVNCSGAGSLVGSSLQGISAISNSALSDDSSVAGSGVRFSVTAGSAGYGCFSCFT